MRIILPNTRYKILNTKNIQSGFIKLSKQALVGYLIAFLTFSSVAGLFLFNPWSTQEADAAWLDDSWLYRKALTIDADQVAGSSDFTDFPILVSMTDSGMANKFQTDGDDIFFVDNNNQRLDHELETVNSTTGNVVAWVKIPSLSATQDSIIYMYYGNASSTNMERATSVWDSNFSGVWHLAETSGTTVSDSTANGNTGTKTAATEPAVEASGQVNGAQDFDGSNDSIDAGSSISLANNSFTIEAWAKREASDTLDTIVGQANALSANNSLDFGFRDSGQGNRIYCGFYANDLDDDEAITDTNWHHWVCKYDASTNAREIYKDGALVASDTASADLAATGTLTIGNHPLESGENFNGDLDEVRITTGTTRSADWITTSYNNQSAPGTFITVGSEEKGPSPAYYWKLDDGQGTTLQDSGSNNENGALASSTATPTWQTEDQCISGKCLYFDGSNDWGSANFSLTDTNVITVEFWMKWMSFADNDDLAMEFSNNNNANNTGFMINPNASTGNFHVSMKCADTGDAYNNAEFTRPTAQTWHHYSIVLDKSQAAVDEIRIYVDGHEQAITKTFSQNCSNSFGEHEFYFMNRGGGNLFGNGFLDDVKIYKFAKTAEQIKVDYNQGAGSVLGTNTQNMPGALSNGLVGYWKMDETSGNATDSSGNGYTLTNTNTATFAAGKFGNAGSFSAASSQYFTVASNSNFVIGNNSRTFTAWVKLSSKGSDRHIFGKWSSGLSNNEYGLYYNSSADRFRFEVTPDGASGSIVAADANDLGSPSTGVWYFVVGKYDFSTGTVSIQVNNGAVNSTSGAGTVFSGSNNLTVGSLRNSSPTNFWNGTIDEARVYNRALSTAEVSQLYNWAPGPKLYLKFDDKTGQSPVDSSGNGYTATLGADTSTASDDPTWTNGKYGNALHFDGTDDYVLLPDTATEMEHMLSADGSGTIQAWVKPTGSPETGSSRQELPVAIIGGWGDVGISRGIVGGEDRIWAFWWTTGSCTEHSIGTTYNVNEWAHIAVVNNAGTMSMYKNGVLVGSTSVGSGTVCTNDHDTRIGVSDFTDNYWSGGVDEVKIYNYPRMQNQLVEDMNAGHPAPGSPVGTPFTQWRFDEGFGTTANNNGNGGTSLTGTLTGMASPATSTSGWTNSGKFNKGLNFDGTNDTVALASESSYDFTRTSPLTISSWIKTSTTTGEHAILSKMADGDPFTGYEFTIDSSFLRFYMIASYSEPDRIEVRSSTNVADGNWHYVSMTYDGSGSASGVKFYVDGKSIATTTESDTLVDQPTNNISPYIGSRNNEGKWFNGSIDEVKIYNQALTAQQITLDMNRGASQVMGALSANSNNQPNAAANEYCIPGDTASCDAPVGRWDFNEGTGTTANDLSGSANTGTITGATFVNGKVNKALNFDGSGDYVSAGSNTSLDDLAALTVEAWIQPNSSISSWTQVVAKASGASPNDGWYVELHGGDEFIAFCQDYTTTDICRIANNSITFDSKTWQHIAVTWTGSSTATDIKMYVNGKEVIYTGATNASGSRVSDAAQDLNIGALNGGGDMFNGKIDDVRVFDYVRTPAQIAWDYNKGGPVAHWKMDECQGTTINDMSGNGFTGTLTIGGSGANTAAGTCSTSGAWANGASGKRNYAMDFDGTDDYILVADNSALDLTGPLTLSAWIKPDALNTMIIDKTTGNSPGGYGMGISGNKIIFTDHAIGATSNTNLSTGIWQHITVTYDGTTTTFYLNGKEDGSSTVISGALSGNANGLYIGRNTPSIDGITYYNGLIDDTRIYNYPLTATQVKMLFNEGATRFGPATGAP